jgi:hypothetical protein
MSAVRDFIVSRLDWAEIRAVETTAGDRGQSSARAMVRAANLHAASAVSRSL